MRKFPNHSPPSFLIFVAAAVISVVVVLKFDDGVYVDAVVLVAVVFVGEAAIVDVTIVVADAVRFCFLRHGKSL